MYIVYCILYNIVTKTFHDRLQFWVAEILKIGFPELVIILLKYF